MSDREIAAKENVDPSTKGAPAWESRTSTPLVSPATGCEKKKKMSLEQGLGMKNCHRH